MRHLVPTLRRFCVLAACTAAASAADNLPTIEAPDLSIENGGVLIAPHGFVARMGDRVLMGDRLRYDQDHDDMYASGDIVYIMPDIRIHADRIGLHQKAESGEAWEVEAQIENKERRYNVLASKIEFNRQGLLFRGVRGSSYGGVLGVGASRVYVALREHPAKDREGFEREVASITLQSPYLTIGGVPVFWLPALARDFTVDYPWTRFEVGHSSRLGNFVRSWIASSLPEFLGLHTVLIGRFDSYTSAGKAGGGGLVWRHPVLGKGLFEYFAFNPEIVHDNEGDGERLAKRPAHVVDTEHRFQIPGGAVSGRWVRIPDADPLVPHGSSAGLPPDERFRSDFMRDDLETRPLARRGVTGAWGTSFGNIVLDTERKHHDELLTTDRLFGAQLEIPETAIIDPVHFQGNAWVEKLRNDSTETEAVRTRTEAALNAIQWFGPIGVDASGGVRGKHYDDGIIADSEVGYEEHRYVGFTDEGLRTRFVGEFANGLTHTIMPRAGIQLITKGTGDELNAYNFGDDRETLEEDKQYGVLSLDTNISRERLLFHANVITRWALRRREREYIDENGAAQIGPSSLVDVAGAMDGSPVPTLKLFSNFSYDALRSRFTSLDFKAEWIVHPRVKLTDTMTMLLADDDHANVWQNRPGIIFNSNRYKIECEFKYRPDGDAIDGIKLEVTRHMVDGDLSISYGEVKNFDGNLTDTRTSVSFTIP